MKKLNYFPRHLHQITKYTEDFEEEEKLIRQALIDFPIDTAVILQLLMTNLWRQKKREESISIANMILLLVDDKQDISSIYYELGVDYNVMGQTDKAIESYNKAVEVDKEDFESIIDLTEIYLEKKEWDNLITTFNLIPDENEDFNMDKFFQQGYAYSMKKEFALAKERFEKYNEKDADNLDVKFNLGSMNAELGNYSIAIKIFSDILEIYPDKAEVYYHIGTVYCSMGDHYMAMHNFLEALKIKPNYPEVYNNIGATQFNDEGDAKKAIDYLQKAVELTKEGDSLRSVLYMNLLVINKKIKNYKAVEYYQKIIANLLGFDILNDETDEDDEE
ncbi:MAG: tetratricopeptide repeat protein [Bacteroidota bacterium]